MGCGASQPRPEARTSYEAAVEQEPRTGVLLARKEGEAISGSALEADTTSRTVLAAAAGPSVLSGTIQPRLAPASRRRSSVDDSAIDIERRSSGIDGLSEMVRHARTRRSSSWGGGDVRCAERGRACDWLLMTDALSYMSHAHPCFVHRRVAAGRRLAGFVRLPFRVRSTRSLSCKRACRRSHRKCLSSKEPESPPEGWQT